MIDLREIYETIDELRQNGKTVGQAEKLALLYIAADYMEREEAKQRRPENEMRGYAQAAEPEKKNDRVEVEPVSEFLDACNGARIVDVLRVVDEHMEAIGVLYPKEYNAVVEKIRITHYT